METEQINKIHEEVLHQAMLKVAGNDLLKEDLRPLWTPQVFVNASCGVSFSELDVRFTKLLVQNLQVIEPQECLLRRPHGDEAVHPDDLCEPYKARAVFWNQC